MLSSSWQFVLWWGLFPPWHLASWTPLLEQLRGDVQCWDRRCVQWWPGHCLLAPGPASAGQTHWKCPVGAVLGEISSWGKFCLPASSWLPGELTASWHMPPSSCGNSSGPEHLFRKLDFFVCLFLGLFGFVFLAFCCYMLFLSVLPWSCLLPL